MQNPPTLAGAEGLVSKAKDDRADYAHTLANLQGVPAPFRRLGDLAADIVADLISPQIAAKRGAA